MDGEKPEDNWVDDPCYKVGLCNHEPCRFWVPYPDCNNCVKQVDRKYTLDEIAKMWGMSRENVRLIEKSALKKLEYRMKEYGIVDFSLRANPNGRSEYARNPKKQWGGRAAYRKPKWPVMVEVFMWKEQIQTEVGR